VFPVAVVRKLILLAVAAVGCSTEIGGGPVSVSFVSPSPGASFMRDSLGGDGALVATVPIELDIGGDIAKVKLSRGETVLGEANDAGELTALLSTPGAATLTATALASDDTPLATATVDIAITNPQVESCRAWLDLYQLEYTVGPTNPGIADPVTVKLPLNGVAYRFNGSAEQRKTLYGDCALMKSLAEAAPIMRSHDIVELVDIGIYNYRCIDQTKTPPNCTLSQHAYAKAIDIAAWVTGDATKYSVLTDWLIDPATTTCTAATDGAKDEFLHKVICELKAAGVWNIVLTPNYNDAHRNHFHVDLSEGANTIKREAPVMDYRLVLDDAGTDVSPLIAD
jgi:hypothetical protein